MQHDKIKLNCHIDGQNAYDKFKRIASEFYKDSTYKFVGLELDKEPTADSVEFSAEFWDVGVADVAPVVHGQWNDNGYGLCICSICGYPPSYIPTHCFTSSFCPKCGAKMDMKD